MSGQAEEPSHRAAPDVNARDLVARAQTLRAGLADALAVTDARLRTSRQIYEAARDDLVNRQMAELPLARLRETTQGRLRLGAIERAGYRNVAQAAAAGRYRLEAIPGVGPQTAAQVIAAASQLRVAMSQGARLRFDAAKRPPLHTKLLDELWALQVARRVVGPISTDFTELGAELDAVLVGASRAASRWKMFFSGRSRREQARRDLDRLANTMIAPQTTECAVQLRDVIAAIGQARPDAARLWRDYEQRAVIYNGLLIEVGGLEADVDAGRGFIPGDIAERVTQQPLDLTLMRASLRGYQVFGAKFALAQGKAILGDEMGLGKSVEALAALCHLHLQGKKHALVVCPASVLVNWEHEIRRHSELRPYRLHGIDRQRNLLAWSRMGGVAVTTFDALRSLPHPDGLELAMLVVDEAHYAKNPAAERTKAVRRWVDTTGRVLFLTGTPMENRVEEFRSLVSHLRPDLVHRINAVDGLVGAHRFRKAVAPVYLRRNQSDVLEELPPRLEAEEWVELQGAALLAYRDAVAAGNFMAMRRAAYSPRLRADSLKLQRLLEIVEEASANGRKVVVFSFFRDVLEVVAGAVGDLAVGPLTGSSTPTNRQQLVDEFTKLRSTG
jgi:SNF2 family DNA or RNA helicase